MRTADPTRMGRILDAAGELFGVRPYYDVCVEEIAARAGVAKGSVYQHFKNKEELFLALTVESMQRLFGEVQAMVAAADKPEEKLLAYIYGVLQFFVPRPHLFEFVEHVDRTQQPSNDALLLVRESYQELLVDIITDLHGPAWKRADLPFAAATLRAILCEMLRTSALSNEDPRTLADRIQFLFLHGIAGPCNNPS